MRKRIITLVVALCVAVTMMPFGTIEAQGKTSLNSDKVYYTSDYHSGDCVLSANVYMMRRAAILRGYSWKGINNTSARKKLCYSFNNMHREYAYHKGYLTFYGGHGYLPGGYQANKKKIKKLLKKHPEGIVVHGYDSYSCHGVLITSYKNGVFYAVDSAYNSHGSNVGIESYSNTSMASLGGCFQYWYLRKVVKDKYTVKYSDGLKKSPKGQTKISSSRLKCGKASKITSKKYKREGYTYKVWNIYKKKNGSLKKIGTVKVGGKMTLKVKRNSTIYLKPVWKKVKVKANLKLDGSAQEM